MVNRPSNAVITRVVVLFSALIAILILSAPSHNVTFAQRCDNKLKLRREWHGSRGDLHGCGFLRGKTSSGRLAVDADAGDFKIEGGVLTFAKVARL